MTQEPREDDADTNTCRDCTPRFFGSFAAVRFAPSTTFPCCRIGSYDILIGSKNGSSLAVKVNPVKFTELRDLVNPGFKPVLHEFFFVAVRLRSFDDVPCLHRKLRHFLTGSKNGSSLAVKVTYSLSRGSSSKSRKSAEPKDFVNPGIFRQPRL
ncbi:hypothetical protein KFK09_029224 [Dendrobium nobile]|uniref:Uncharacterized protein n=1 Tax=Dendrobium nobile TaxID=94219 RepID=A0A8T3A5D0_DENNO|nr:hypothetical protein KFK09_029224 [Dendrobium nobile]